MLSHYRAPPPPPPSSLSPTSTSSGGSSSHYPLSSSSVAAMYDESCYNPGVNNNYGHYNQRPPPPRAIQPIESAYYDSYSFLRGSNQQPPPVDRVVDQYSADLIKQFMRAACSNCIQMITNMIVNDVVSPNAQDSSHMTALMYAAVNGHMTVVRKLIEFGAHVGYIHPYTQNTCLHLAAQCGHTRTVELILKTGDAKPLLSNRDGKTAYQLARDFGHGNNKVMKRLFKEYGGYIAVGGGQNKRGGRSREDLFELSSHSGSTTGLDSDDEDDDRMTAKSVGSSSVQSQKQSSMLPNFELLSRFREMGLYRPLASGKGFAFLTPHGTIKEMLKYTQISLQIPSSKMPGELKRQLESILLDFEQDTLGKAQRAYHRDQGDSLVGSSGEFKRNIKESSPPYNTLVLDAQTEMDNYQAWLKANAVKIEEMIDALGKN